MDQSIIFEGASRCFPHEGTNVMIATEVFSLYAELESLGITIWIEGGWGVDALLGEQTRPHKDLDIAVQRKDVPRLCQLLEARGYKEIKLEDSRPWNFV